MRHRTCCRSAVGLHPATARELDPAIVPVAVTLGQRDTDARCHPNSIRHAIADGTWSCAGLRRR